MTCIQEVEPTGYALLYNQDEVLEDSDLGDARNHPWIHGTMASLGSGKSRG